MVLSFAAPPPGSAKVGFGFGIHTVSAEDCPAEFEYCGGGGPLNEPWVGIGGGGGGGGQIGSCKPKSNWDCVIGGTSKSNKCVHNPQGGCK